MAQEFNYTDSVDGTGSTAVDYAYFDAETQQVAVVLLSGMTYVYQGVTEAEWHTFANAPSLGRAYGDLRQDSTRNMQFNQFDEFSFDLRPTVYSQTGAVAEPSLGKTVTTIVIALDGKVTLELPGDVKADEALKAFIKAFTVDSSGELVGQPRVLSRTVVKTETF